MKKDSPALLVGILALLAGIVMVPILSLPMTHAQQDNPPIINQISEYPAEDSIIIEADVIDDNLVDKVEVEIEGKNYSMTDEKSYAQIFSSGFEPQ
jgi:hypothetical protein